MKKVISMVLSIIMMLSVTSGIGITAYAAGNNIDAATAITLNKTYNGSITSSNKADYYKVTISTSGLLSFDLTSYIKSSVKVNIYDSSKESFAYYYLNYDSATGRGKKTPQYDLVSGVYYISFTQDGSYTGKYELKATFTSANESFKETGEGINNNTTLASKINLGTKYNGQIAYNDNSDFYKFTLSGTGYFNLNFVGDLDCVYIVIYDANENRVGYWYIYRSSDTNQAIKNIEMYLLGGDYYFAVVKQNNYTGNYYFTASHTIKNETFKETVNSKHDDLQSAFAISLGQSVYGVRAYNEGNDFYQLKVSQKTNIKLTFSASNTTSVDLKVYDSQYDCIYTDYLYMSSDTNRIDYNKTYTLNAGTYYIGVISDNTFEYNLKTDQIINVAKPTNLKVASRKTTSIKLSWKKASGVDGYEVQKKTGGKWKSVANTTSNSYTITKLKAGIGYDVRVRSYKTISGKKYYSSFATLKAVTKPATPKIKAPSTNSKHEIKVNWNPVSSATGYQVQFAKNKSCSKVIATRTVKGKNKKTYTGKNFTKGRTYYVRVRSYKTVNGTKYYSSWSAVKAIKSK